MARSRIPPNLAVEDLQVMMKTTPSAGTSYSHEISMVHKDDSIFYLKKPLSGDRQFDLTLEATAGKLFNLLMPYQPYTTIIQNRKGEPFLLSEEVPGFLNARDIRALPINVMLQEGALRGLGSLAMAGYFLNEVDFSPAGLGMAMVDGQQTLIKVGNDWCFGALKDPEQFGYSSKGRTAAITEQSLLRIPIMTDYNVYTLFDIIQKGVANDAYTRDDATRLLSDELPDMPHIRQEVNEMILKITLMPIELIKDILQQTSHDPKDIAKILDEVSNRRQQVFKAAVKNDSFMNFFQKLDHQDFVEKWLHDIHQFQQRHQLPMRDYANQINHSIFKQGTRMGVMVQYESDDLPNRVNITPMSNAKPTVVSSRSYSESLDVPAFKYSPLSQVASQEIKEKHMAKESMVKEVGVITLKIAELRKVLSHNGKHTILTSRERYDKLHSLQQNLINIAELSGKLNDVEGKKTYIQQAQTAAKEMASVKVSLPLDNAKHLLTRAKNEMQKAAQLGHYDRASLYADEARLKAEHISSLSKDSKEKNAYRDVAQEFKKKAAEYKESNSSEIKQESVFRHK